MPLRLPHMNSYPAIESQVLILGRNEVAVNVKEELVVVQIEARQAFQPDVLAGVVNLQRLTYVELCHDRRVGLWQTRKRGITWFLERGQ